MSNTKQSLTPQQFSYANLVATDKYGRKVPVCNPQEDNGIYVGVFYSAWLGYHMTAKESGNGKDIFCVDELEKLGDNSPLYEVNHEKSPTNCFHFASEPLFGYYSMKDPWVVNRHIEMLTMSGIDYLMFDTTNRRTYPEAVDLVLATLRKYKSQGWKVPHVSFYTNTWSKTTITDLYNRLYLGKPEYNDLWLRFKGDDRPVIVGVSTENAGGSDMYEEKEAVDVNSDMYKYYNFFESQWPCKRRNEKKGFPWIMTWDTAPFPNENGNIATSVIQHCWESVFASSQYNSASRGYYGEDNNAPDGKNPDWKKGDNLEWQINSAREWIKLGKVKNMIITGWNEWMAIKNPWGSPSYGENVGTDDRTKKHIYFVDSYNAEFSRDMEPGKVYGDGFYMQLLRHVREIKYGKATAFKTEKIKIKNLSDLSVWDSIKTEYADFEGDAMARDGENAVNIPHSYVDNSNRNDIASIKVAHDESNLYFAVKTMEDVTEHENGDNGWMNIMFGVTENENAFMGFNYIINRHPNKTGKTSIEKCVANGEYKWQMVAEAEYAKVGNVMVYKIPLSAVGLGDKNLTFTFKVTDNVFKPEEEMSYYIYGDSAPIGRMAFAYNVE